jgi:hypothetical protein
MAYLKPVLVVCFLILAAAATFVGFDAYRMGILPLVPSPLQSACVDLLTSRLKAPATLNVISSEQYMTPLSMARITEELTWANVDSPEVVKFRLEDISRALAEGKQGPREYEVFLTYDAANSFGTPLRSVGRCTIIDMYGDYPSGFSLEDTMKLDGFDRRQWLAEQMKKLPPQ